MLIEVGAIAILASEQLILGIVFVAVKQFQETGILARILQLLIYRIERIQHFRHTIYIAIACGYGIAIGLYSCIGHIETTVTLPSALREEIFVVFLRINLLGLEHHVREHRHIALQMIYIHQVTRRVHLLRDGILTMRTELIVQSGIVQFILFRRAISLYRAEIHQSILIERVVKQMISNEFFQFILREFCNPFPTIMFIKISRHGFVVGSHHGQD